MNIKRIAAIAVLVFSSLSAFAPSALAGTCFCNIEGTGATATGGASDTASCRDICTGMPKSQGYQWAGDVSQGPSSLLQCFRDKDQCEKDMNRDDVVDGTFSSAQPVECLPGWHYCYPADSEKYTLQISIPGTDGKDVTSVYNYGEYVGAMYKYLLGVSVTIAIVFVMIGGIRYVVGASTGEVGKAKEMIVKAITGLVLLLFAYVILYTVNPELVKLQVPKLPMLRRVELLTGGVDCQSLVDKEYSINELDATDGKYGRLMCGSIAEVLKKPDGTEVVEGTTCVYNKCDKIDPACGEYASTTTVGTCIGAGNEFRCVKCGQVYPGTACNLEANAGACSWLDPADVPVNQADANPAYSEYNVCGYTQAPSMFSNAVSSTFVVTAIIASAGAATIPLGGWYTVSVAAEAVAGSCAEVNINCLEVVSCTDYNSSSLDVANIKTNNELDDLDFPILGSPNIVEICNADPCGVSRVDGKAKETCAYNEGTGNCQSSSYAPAVVDYGEDGSRFGRPVSE